MLIGAIVIVFFLVLLGASLIISAGRADRMLEEMDSPCGPDPPVSCEVCGRRESCCVWNVSARGVR